MYRGGSCKAHAQSRGKGGVEQAFSNKRSIRRGRCGTSCVRQSGRRVKRVRGEEEVNGKREEGDRKRFTICYKGLDWGENCLEDLTGRD